MSTKKTASFPILGILGLIFITLKLAGIGVVGHLVMALGIESVLDSISHYVDFCTIYRYTCNVC